MGIPWVNRGNTVGIPYLTYQLNVNNVITVEITVITVKMLEKSGKK